MNNLALWTAALFGTFRPGLFHNCHQSHDTRLYFVKCSAKIVSIWRLGPKRGQSCHPQLYWQSFKGPNNLAKADFYAWHHASQCYDTSSRHGKEEKVSFITRNICLFYLWVRSLRLKKSQAYQSGEFMRRFFLDCTRQSFTDGLKMRLLRGGLVGAASTIDGQKREIVYHAARKRER